MTAVRRLAVVAVMLAATAGRVTAQPAAGGAARATASRIEVAVAGAWAGTSDLGTSSAALTPNLNGGAYALFDASAQYATPIGGDVRLSVRVTPWLLVGVAGSLASGQVRVRIGAEAEGGTPTSFTGETLAQGQVEGRADVLLTRWRFWGARVTPYLTASAGALRQWHEGNVHVDTGSVLQGGAGLRYGFFARIRPKTRTIRAGAAAEVRMTRASGGFHWGRESRTMPSARVECFMGWGR